MCTIRFDLRVGRPRLDLVALSTPTYGPIADSNWEYRDIYWKLYISTSGDWDSLTKTNTLNIHRKWRLGSALQKFTCSSPDLVWSGLIRSAFLPAGWRSLGATRCSEDEHPSKWCRNHLTWGIGSQSLVQNIQNPEIIWPWATARQVSQVIIIHSIHRENLQPKSHTASHPWLLYDHSKCSALHTLDVRRRLHHRTRFQTSLVGDGMQQKRVYRYTCKSSGLSCTPRNNNYDYIYPFLYTL